MNPSTSAIETAMRAAVLHDYGPPEKLAAEKVPLPTCGRRQLVIRVRAAGVNPIDWRIRSGSLRWLLPASFPLVLGFDVAGEIVDLGAEAEAGGWQVGEEVLAFLNNRHGGGYAEYAAADADVVVRKPENVTFEEAAGVPLAASTALQALRDHGSVKDGHEVLINGASGGVGHFAVQIAVLLGARVTGVCSGENLDFVRQLGAEEVIDYRREDFAKREQTYDVVFDVAAKCTYRQCRRALKPHGRYVTTVPSAGNLLQQALNLVSRRDCKTMLVRAKGDDLRQIAQWIAEEKVRPVVQRTYPLEEAAAAHRASEAGHARGKLVVSIR